MKISLAKLAELTDSVVSGNPLTPLNSVAPLEGAVEGQISFISNKKYIKLLGTSKASAVILTPQLAENYQGNALINSDPYLTFAKVLDILHEEEKQVAIIHPNAVIADDVSIEDSVSIGANAIIESGVKIEGNVSIGAGCYIGKKSTLKKFSILHPNVSVYPDTQIGERTIIHSGTVIGADGFGFAPENDKTWYKIKQIGNVVIGDDVEIGANTTIDRAALGATLINNGVKLDNQIQIAHNVKIGKHTAIAAGTVVAGSTVIGEYCQIGGAVAIAGHLKVADGVIITGKSMVIKSIKSPGVYSSGIASDENRKWRRNAARFRQLDEMAKKLSSLEKKINEINNDN
jgi:UDP-3-O-[3-hydroxymyristoyl] glucosamine N-acyltransferase